MVAGIEECSYSELALGPFGLFTTASDKKMIRCAHQTSIRIIQEQKKECSPDAPVYEKLEC